MTFRSFSFPAFAGNSYQRLVRSMDSERRVEFALCVLASIALVWSVFAPTVLLSHDGPQHIFLAHLSNHYSDSESLYRQYYEPGQPLTALGYGLLFGPLEGALGWRLAHQTAVAVIALVWAWGARSLIRSTSETPSALGLMPFAVALQWSMFMGFYAFVLSTGLGFFAIAIALRTWKNRFARPALLGSVLLLQALSHVFGSLLTGAVLLALVASAKGSLRSWRPWLELTLVHLLPMIIAVYTWGLTSEPNLVSQQASVFVWPDLMKRVAYLADLFVAGPLWRCWPPVLLAVAGILSVLFTWKRTSRTQRTLALSSAAILILALITPLHIRGRWEFLSPRFTPLAVILGIALLPSAQRKSRYSKAILVATTGFAFTSITWAGMTNRELEQLCSEPLSGLTTAHPKVRHRLPIITDTKCGAWKTLLDRNLKYVEPILNVGALYAVESGEISPYMFTQQPRLHPWIVSEQGYRLIPEVPPRQSLWTKAMTTTDPLLRNSIVDQLAQAGSLHDGILLSGPSADSQAFVKRGYLADVQHGGLLIGRYVGCPTSIAIQTEQPTAAATFISFGWSHNPVPVWSARLESVHPVELPRAPCGTIWTRILIDRDNSDTLSPGDGACAGADPTGLIAWPDGHPSALVCVEVPLSMLVPPSTLETRSNLSYQ